ncbi:hypothetical protein [Devosia sp. Root635]|uniref:hypothetical protein n=1 Tax=Devosia sp. Root635 TaxID=1736575 RepID=UPI0006FBEA89|nr:hypothetical protein [Devosia sp. Root635]KRA45742.1 hypothetical protein ASD80_05325 [Devosia sp. Root635]
MSSDSSSFEVKGCEVRYFGPHQTISGRVTGVVRVLIEERFMGNVSRYPLDLKVKADVGSVSTSEVRTALLTHAAHQVNRLKARHTDKLPVAAE